MSQQTINVGTSPNDGTGTPLRTAFQYTNSNFSELYTAVGPSGNNIVVPGTATITGDLTVDTNVLKVDSLNNRVGILTASPSYTFQIGTNDLIANSTGLGVGTNPSYKLHIKNDLSELYFRDNGTSSELLINSEAGARSALYFGDTVDTVRGGIVYDSTTDALEIRGYNNATRVTLDSSGNLGLSVTPSAWNAGYKALELASNVGAWSATTGISDFSLNSFFNVSSQWIYKTTAAAVLYRQNAGQHLFFNAPVWNPATNPTGVITFTQAMTLDASGNLVIGTTSAAARFHVEGAGAQGRFSTASASDARHEYFRNGVREGLVGWDANLFQLLATQATGELALGSGNTIRVRLNSAGDVISNVTGTAPTLTTNSQMVFNLTSDTNLRISVRGADGTTRTANITLA